MADNQPIHFVPLEAIDANPYNCRLGEDADVVKKVALSIAAEGLMQFPIGRLVGGKIPDGEEDLRGNSVEMLLKGGHRVQLAFGHTRLAAFKFLRDTGNPNFDMIPIILKGLEDDEMFQYGVSENLARKDLTPIEEATAMKRYRDEFKKTSEEIGSLFHLAAPTVRNKIRLLELPEDVRQKLNERYISEGAARALLGLYDLPQDIREAGERHRNEIFKPSWIVDQALSGKTAEQVSDYIDRLLCQFAVDMADSTWKYDEVFEGADLVGACKGCQFMVRSEKRNLCLKKACYYAKKKVMERRYLEQASRLVRIDVLGGDADSSITEFRGGDNNVSALKLAKLIHCPNLRLIFDPYEHFSYNENDNHLKEIGFPKAKIVCGKQSQWCACINAVKAGLQDMLMEKSAASVKGQGLEPEYVPVADSEDPGTPDVPATVPVTYDQLKAVSKAARQAKKETLEEIEEMKIDAGKIIAKGLMDINNPRIWLEILRKINYTSASEIDTESKGDYTDNPMAWCDEIRLAIGMAIAQQTGENYYYSEPDSRKSLDRLNDYLKKAGLQELEYGVSAETVNP